MLTPDNYDAYKGRQRQQDDARKQFLTVAKLEGDASSPVSDAQLSDQVANLTGSRPAPEDMVRANRELFREADDRAWAEKLGAEAPKTLAMLSDPRSGSISRADAEAFASIEQTLSNVGKVPSAVGGGAPLQGVQLASTSEPVPVPKEASVLPPLPLPNSTTSAPIAAPLEAEEGAGTPSVGAPAAAPASLAPTAVPRVEGTGQAFAAGGAGAEESASIEAADVPPTGGDEAAIAPPSIEGAGRASALAGAGTQASVNVNVANPPTAAPDEKVPGTAPSVEGHGEASAEVVPGAQASVSADVGGEAEAVPVGEALVRAKEAAEKESTSTNAAANREIPPGVEGTTVVSSSTAQNNSGAPAAGNFIPIGGWLALPSEDQRISPELVKGIIASSIGFWGGSEELIGRITEPSPEKIQEIEAIAHSIAYANAEDYDKLRVMASQQYYYYYKDLYRELDSVVFEHKDPQQVLKYLNEVRLDTQRAAQDHQASGKYWQDYARTNWAAEPGQENSFPRMVGEATPDILAALSIPRVAGMLGLALYGALRSGGNAVSSARMAGASEAVQTEAGLWGAGWGALTSFSLAEKVAKIPFVKNVLGRTAGTILVGGLEGVQQASQKAGENVIAWWKFNKNQKWLEGVGPAFLGGAITSYLGTVIGKVHLSGQNYIALKSMSSEVALWKANGGDPEVFRNFSESSLRGTPAEYLYIPPDEFFVAMKEIGEDPREVFRKIKGAPIPDFDLAVSSGADLRIPTASYLVDFAGMKEGDAMLRHLRFDPADMTWAEAEKHSEEARKALDGIIKDVPQWETDAGVSTGDVPAAPPKVPLPDTRSGSPSPNYPHESAKGKAEQQRENEARREAEARQRADGAKIRKNNTAKKRGVARQHKLEKEARKRAFYETQKGLSEGPTPSTDKDTLMRSVSPWSPF